MSEELETLRADDYSNIKNLENDLYSDISNPNILKKSLRNLSNLISTYNRDKMVSFIGAGTSKPLGISDWEELMKTLCVEANKKGFTKNFEDFSDNTDIWPSLAQDIFNYLKSENKISVYFDVLKKNMVPKINSTTLTLVKLILALNFHLTTNFDNSIEYAYTFLNYLFDYVGAKEKNIVYTKYFIPDFSPFFLKKQEASICYLHGNVDKDIYILKKQDYEKYYPSVSNTKSDSKSLELEDFLKLCYKNKYIIFIGFSFQDYYVREFFFNLSKEIEREQKIATELYMESGNVYPEKEIKHYLVIDEEILRFYSEKFGNKKDRNLLHDNFEKYNIYVIIYKKEDYIFLEKLFEFLSQRNLYE